MERWSGVLTEKKILRGTYSSMQVLEATICRYVNVRNENPKPFVLTKTADGILVNIARFCLRTSGTRH